MTASLRTPDFKFLVDQVLTETRRNGGDTPEALRVVIERHGLSDYDGVQLFSAMMASVREAALAA